MAKAKATPDETIKRGKTPAKSTPKASAVEKTQSFTAAFKSDAHAAADYGLGDRVELSREESDAGPAGITVTVTYK